MNPEKRCSEWYQELFAVRDNRGALEEKINHILDVLVTEDNNEVALATMRALLTSRELPTLPDITQSSLNFNKFYRRYRNYIVDTAKNIDRPFYTIEKL